MYIYLKRKTYRKIKVIAVALLEKCGGPCRVDWRENTGDLLKVPVGNTAGEYYWVAERCSKHRATFPEVL